MKNTLFSKVLFLLLFVLSSEIDLKAQNGSSAVVQDSHFFTISLSGGASGFAMMPSYRSILVPEANFGPKYEGVNVALPEVLHPDMLKIRPFLGGSFGVGYEFQSKVGVFVNVGLEAQLYSGSLHHTDSIRRLNHVMDGNVETGRKPADIEYTVIKWDEQQTVLAMNIPIMVGYKHHESGYYGGVGVKVGYSLYSQLVGDYGFANCNLDYEETMPMPGIKESIPLDNNKSVDSNFLSLPRIVPMIEVGWQNLVLEVNKKNKIRFKFALVGEFDLLSAYKNLDSAEELFDRNNLDGFTPKELANFFKEVNSFYSTIPLGMSKDRFDELKNGGKFLNFNRPATLHSWFVGVKVGIMFEFPQKKKCNCLQNNVTKPWSKRRINYLQ